MASYTYKGTKVKGTGSSNKKGHAAKKSGETYLNTDSGHVYRSTAKGNKDDKIWKYQHTDIIGKPDIAVSNLGTPKREGLKYTAEWKVPAKLTESTNGKRATMLSIDWWLGLYNAKDPKRVSDTKNEKATTSSITLNSNLKIGGKAYSRDAFYPYAGKPKLDYIKVRVNGQNSKGHGSKPADAQIDFALPAKPSISNGSFDKSNGRTTFTITTDAGTGKAERFDTEWIMKVKTGASSKFNLQYGSGNTHQTSTSFDVSYDATDYQLLDNDQYIHIHVWARARGFKGPSEWTDREFLIGYPAIPLITKITADKTSGRTIVAINNNANNKSKDATAVKAHTVEGVRLITLVNVDYASPSEIPGDEQGDSTEIIDNGSCSALTIDTSELLPDKGKHTYVRVKSWRIDEERLYRYTEWAEVKDLFVVAPTAADDRIEICSVTPGADGESLVCQLAFDDGATPSTGTELTWSEDEDAWTSTREPNKHEFEWQEGSYEYGGITYPHSAKITIKDLEENTKYYIKARRYLEGDTTTYSGYATGTGLTGEIPESIVASCARYIPSGSSLLVSWIYSGNGIQNAWMITDPTGELVYVSGEGSAGSTRISADNVAERAVNGTLEFKVWASTGGDPVPSETQTVTVIDPPTAAVTLTSPLTVQPLSFDVTTNNASDLIVIVTSNGATGQFADGLRVQANGDTVYSAVLDNVSWTISNGAYTATVALPEGLDFWDMGEYTLSVTAVDRQTGLKSDPVETVFGIAWANPAVDIGEAVTLTEIDEVDESDVHHQAVQINLTPPEGSAETDLYDIYRMTSDGAYLIGYGFPLTHEVVDEYAPFGDVLLRYRIAIRTVDGDESFADFEYDLEGDAMRFDWAEGTLELPYNISIGDSYAKDVDIRQHMDGGIDGYWNPNITRTGKFSSSIIPIEQPSEQEQARRLARYAGPVFVRLPNGSAYEADVQVSDLSAESSKIMSIALDATEVDLTNEFILPNPYLLEEGEEEEA